MKTRYAGFEPIHHDRLIQEQRHDTYKSKHQLAEPTVCPQCGAVYHDGRWQWLAKPAQAHAETCPACQRVHDNLPAGYVTIGGAFFQQHRDELLHQIKHQEAKARAEQPLQRIVKIADQDGGLLITTTDIHLARGIGEALHHAYQGELEFHYNKQENLLRVVWER
jgi:NMD protein affecting ribosome stability and mRNA decay